MADNRRIINAGTIIQVDLKTLFIILGVVISSFTTMYWRLSNEIDGNKQEIKQLKEQDLKSISDQVGKVDEKLLNFFMKFQEEFNKNNIPTDDKTIPENIKPRKPNK